VPASGSALYYVEDMRGSSRAIVQSNGTLCYDVDLTPFGAESTFTSSCFQNYKFEGKERDAETGNDNFGAREYSWRFGRWLSSDWSAVPVPVPYANLTNPQTLNLYAMVADDPESFADLDGHSLLSWVFAPLMGTNDDGKPPDPLPPPPPPPPPSAKQQMNQMTQSPAKQTNGQTPANNTPGKQPIVVPNVEDLAGHAPFGNHNGTCYDLGVAYGMAPSSKQISPGSAPNANTQEGTLVGTFSGNGGTTFTPKSGLGHIAAFLGFGDRKGINPGNAKGMWVMDQYARRGKVDRSFIPFGGTKNYNNDANNYRIVLSPKKED